MLSKLYGVIASFGLVGTLLGAASAMAEDQVVGSDAPQAQVPDVQNLFGGGPLDAAALAANSGGTDTQVFNDAKLSGVVSGNQATNVITGNNSIADGSFSGMSGMPMVVQNSGNNVLIQNSTIVNVQVQ